MFKPNKLFYDYKVQGQSGFDIVAQSLNSVPIENITQFGK